MIPQQQGVTVTSLSAPPDLEVSLTFNVSTLLGKNKVSRLAHSTVNFYSGSSQVDSVMRVPPATYDQVTGITDDGVVTIPLNAVATKAVQLATQQPITAVLTVNNQVVVLPVSKMLLLDSPVTHLELRNSDTTSSPKVIVTYLT